MATSTTIPVTIDPEAAALITFLGLEQPYREMVEHAKQTIPNLRRIEVEYGHKVEDPENPTINLFLIRGASNGLEDLSNEERQWDFWVSQAYPPDVFRRLISFVMDDDS